MIDVAFRYPGHGMAIIVSPLILPSVIFFIISLLFLASILFLFYARDTAMAHVSAESRRYAIPTAKYVIATFIATYGSLSLGAVITFLPLLLYQRMVHTQNGSELFSALLDRPYFPFQTAIAFVLGYVLSEWLKEGRPVYVWVWPAIQATVAVLLFRPSVMQTFTAGVWHTYFDWSCGCSVTLLQWTIMSPLYPSIAFSVATFLRSRRFSRTISPAH
jgi:hypothetical protein